MPKIDYEQNYEDAAQGRLDLPLGWEIGRPQPIVVRLAEEGRFRGGVLDAGCGTGENALFLAARGCDVTGVDSSRLALDTARAKAEERGLRLTLVQADACAEVNYPAPFDTVLDCGLMHSLDPDQRPAYAATLASVCEQDAICHLLCFSDAEPSDWGPHRLTRDEVVDAMAGLWEPLSVVLDTLHSWRPDSRRIGPVHAWHGEFRRRWDNYREGVCQTWATSHRARSSTSTAG